MKILALGGIRRGMGALANPTSVAVAVVQCAINRFGATIDVDGYFGPQTRSALAAVAGSYQIAGGEVEAFTDPGNDATRITLSERFAAWLIADTLCEREASSAPSAPRSSGSTPVVRTSAPFWRRDNWKAWAVAATLAAGIGVGGAYLMAKPNRKRSKS